MITLLAPSLTTKWNKNAMSPLVFTMRGLSSGSGGPVAHLLNPKGLSIWFWRNIFTRIDQKNIGFLLISQVWWEEPIKWSDHDQSTFNLPSFIYRTSHITNDHGLFGCQNFSSVKKRQKENYVYKMHKSYMYKIMVRQGRQGVSQRPVFPSYGGASTPRTGNIEWYYVKNSCYNNSINWKLVQTDT